MVRAKVYKDTEIAALAQAFTRTDPEKSANESLQSFVPDFLKRLEQLSPVGLVQSDRVSAWGGKSAGSL
jgi:hypothetical protein